MDQSLWLDEAVQAITATKSFSFIFEEIKGDFHPPLYHFLMHFWVRVFGNSEISLRMPSVFFGVATVYFVYKIVEFIDLKSFKFLPALILATSQFHIYYSQEARMYALSCFLATFTMYWWLKIVKSITKDKKVYPQFKLAYLICALFLIYTDYYGIMVVVSQIIGGLIIFRKNLKNFINELLSVYLLIFIFYLPWTPMLFNQIKTGKIAIGNLPKWTNTVNLDFWKALPLTLVKFSLGRITIFNKKIYALVSFGLLGLTGWLGGWGFYKNYKNDKYKLILIWFLLPTVGAWLISLIIPNYQPFRLILVLPAFWLLLTKGILEMKNKKVKLAIAGIFLGINMCSILTYWNDSYFWREDWRGVAQYLNRENLSLIISSSASDWPLIYYGVGEKTIGVIEGVKEIKVNDKYSFLEKIQRTKSKRIAYTPYLSDIYDRENLVHQWLKEEGFVKIEEISFNQIPVFVYENRN